MKFNIKTAMEYSSKLKNLTNDVENSLGVSNSLVNRYDNDSTDVPATTNGLYNATVTHKKASLNKVLGKVLEDEVLEVKAKSDLTKISPAIRLKMVSDLIEEREKIDYEIETAKNTNKIVDEFSGKEITYDFGCQVNKEYRKLLDLVLQPLINMNEELSITINGRMIDVSGEKSSVVVYPIDIVAKSNVDSNEVLKQFEDIDNKVKLNSAKLSEVQITKYFEFEPKFNLNPSVRSLIQAYAEK
jgi:hypothetical protein